MLNRGDPGVVSALFAGLASAGLFAAAPLAGSILLLAAVVPLVVRNGLGDLFRGQLASTKMQNIVCD
jgi:hypothetical protein